MFKDIFSKTNLKLKNNIGTSILLFFIMLTFYAIVGFATFMLLFIPPKYDISLNKNITLLINLSISFLLISPFSLSVQKFFFCMNRNNFCITEGFFYFGNIKKYFHSVLYSISKYIIITIVSFVCFLPAIITIAFLARSVLFTEMVYDSSYLIFFVLLFAFLLIGIILFLYILMGFFISDYIFIKSISKNPFKILSISNKIMKNNRIELLKLFLIIAPFLLLSILIITIPLTIIYIHSIISIYSDTKINKYLQQN